MSGAKQWYVIRRFRGATSLSSGQASVRLQLIPMSLEDTTRRLDATLRPLGFARRNMTWNRRTGDFIDIIDFQVSKFAELVTMNARVLHAGVYRHA